MKKRFVHVIRNGNLLNARLNDLMDWQERGQRLARILAAGLAGDSDALAWLYGEGFIHVYLDAETGRHASAFVRWDDKRFFRHTSQYREWRKAVFERDGYRCARCHAGGYMEAHHIAAWATHPERRYDVSNGQTLCADCHAEQHPPLKLLRTRQRSRQQAGA